MGIRENIIRHVCNPIHWRFSRFVDMKTINRMRKQTICFILTYTLKLTHTHIDAHHCNMAYKEGETNEKHKNVRRVVYLRWGSPTKTNKSPPICFIWARRIRLPFYIFVCWHCSECVGVIDGARAIHLSCVRGTELPIFYAYLAAKIQI